MNRLYNVLVAIVATIGIGFILLGLLLSLSESSPPATAVKTSLTEALLDSWGTIIWLVFLIGLAWKLAGTNMRWVWKVVLGLLPIFFIFLAVKSIAKKIPEGGHGGGITIPSFVLNHKLGIALLILCALFIGIALRKRKKKEDEANGKEDMGKKGPEEGSFISMDNVFIVLIVALGAVCSVYWIFARSGWENKEILGSIAGLVFLHEAWQIFAHGKDTLKGYQWIIRLGCFFLGLWFPLSILLPRLSIEFR